MSSLASEAAQCSALQPRWSKVLTSTPPRTNTSKSWRRMAVWKWKMTSSVQSASEDTLKMVETIPLRSRSFSDWISSTYESNCTRRRGFRLGRGGGEAEAVSVAELTDLRLLLSLVSVP